MKWLSARIYCFFHEHNWQSIRPGHSIKCSRCGKVIYIPW